MPERWRNELRRIDQLDPDDDLVERAIERPVRPEPVPVGIVKIAIIALALAVPIAMLSAVLFIDRRGSVAPGTGDGVAPMPAPANGELLYAKRLNGGWSLFTLNPDTGTERQITDGYRDYGSDWSPDGMRIVYDSESPGGGQGIWIVNADGSDATKLIDDGSVPAWSPNGTRIVFARADVGEMVPFGEGAAGTPFYLYVMDAGGSNVVRLTEGRFADYSPAWSPDGTQIAFLRYDRDGTSLFVMNADGSGARRIAGPDIEAFGAPAWSADGGSIALAVNGSKGGSPGGIMLLSAGGSIEGSPIPGTEVEYPDYVSDPAWSPDGAWIAYTHGYEGEIVILRPDGSDRRTLEVSPGTDSIEELAWGVAPPPE